MNDKPPGLQSDQVTQRSAWSTEWVSDWPGLTVSETVSLFVPWE